MKLRIATAQFPVSADIARNTEHVLRQMDEAHAKGADVVHFGECALSGYAGPDFASYSGFDWPELERCSREVLSRAAALGLWTLLGSSHRLTGRRKPHNSVYVIDDRGRIADRYDKRFCAGDRRGRTGDLAHYTPGDHFAVFTVRGIRCGILICHEYRYPELYREYKQRGVEVMFHSYHTGNIRPSILRQMKAATGRAFHRMSGGSTLPEITMPAAMRAAAASSHVWISCSNTSARESCWPAFFVRADGVVTGRLRKHTAGVLLSTVDTEAPLYDSTVAWRERAMAGTYHSGRLADDPRSHDRTSL